MSKRIDRTNIKYGRLTAKQISHTKNGRLYWICDCDCGNINIVVGGASLMSLNTKSCGCLKREASRENSPFKETRTIDDRFNESYKIEENGCWNWIKARDKHGYGSIKYKRKQIKAHRLSFMLYNNNQQLTSDEIICHHCDNPPCVNPKHLYLGTFKTNSDDKIRRGRSNYCYGQYHPMCKLTDDQIIEIRNSKNISQYQLAIHFGVSQPHISEIIRKKQRSNVKK